MMKDLVSIIMPSFNTAKYIGESVKSVLGQTYQNWELIIVDDGSTDNTREVVRAFDDDRVIFIQNEHNVGAAVSRNRALALAKGKWIAFLDSDDIWEKTKLERQIDFMLKNDYHFSYTSYREIDIDGNDLGLVVSGPRKITQSGMYNYNWIGCLTAMYDAQKVGLIQIEDIKKRNDYAIWLKVIQKTDCYLLDEELALYRRGRQGSISTNSYFALVKWHYRLFRHAQKMGVVMSVVNTARNLVFGLYKKKVYIKYIR